MSSAAQLPLEAQVPLGGEQPLDEGEGRREQDPVPALDQLVPDGGDDV